MKLICIFESIKLNFKFGDVQFMFVLKNKMTVGFLIYCLQK